MAALTSTANLCFGLAALAFGGGGGSASNAAVGLAGLAEWVIERRQRFGPECPRVVGRIRKEVQHAFIEAFGREADWAAADLQAADEALHAALGKGCTVSRDELVAAALSPESFPNAAVDIVMQRLSKVDNNRFGQNSKDSFTQQYAVAVLKGGLRAAVKDENYFRKLEPELLLGMASAIGQVREDTAEIREITHGLASRTLHIEAMLEGIQIKIGTDDGTHVLRTVAERFCTINPKASIADIQEALEHAADDYLRLREQLADFTKHNDHNIDLIRMAQVAIDAGLFHEADRTLDQAEVDFQEHVTLHEIRKQAHTREIRATTALLALDVSAAAGHMRKIVEWFTPFDINEAVQRAIDGGKALRSHSYRLGGAGAKESIALLNHAVNLTDEFETPIHWACAQTALGNSYYTLGASMADEDGMKSLWQAVDAHSAALRVFKENYVPSEWANTQMNIGSAYLTIDKRTKGNDGVKALNSAISSNISALRVLTKTDTPRLWASAQSNLGNAYQLYGERRLGASGMEALDSAVSANEAALSVLSKETELERWTTTQNNLGNAHLSRGLRLIGRAGTEALDKAVEAYEAAAVVTKKAGYVANWAVTQMSLGNTYLTLADRQLGDDRNRTIRRAIEAYYAALTVQTETETPASWALTQSNLGNAKIVYGRSLAGDESLKAYQQAVTACEAALRVQSEAYTASDWAATQCLLGEAYFECGRHYNGEERIDALERAIKAYEAALRVQTEVDDPIRFSRTQGCLGNAHHHRGYLLRGEPRDLAFKMAVKAYHRAQGTRSMSDDPIFWATTKGNLGSTLLARSYNIVDAERMETLNDAAEACEAALVIFTEEDAPIQRSGAQHILGLVRLAQADCTSGSKEIEFVRSATDLFQNAARVLGKVSIPREYAEISRSLLRAQRKLSNLESNAR